MSFTIAGLDPALSNLGMAKGKLDLSKDILTLTHLELIKTSPSKVKTIRKNSDDVTRCKELYTACMDFLKDVDLVCIELPVGSQSARAMASYGACMMLIATIKQPVIQVTPNEVKMAGAGIKNASKQAMIDWATNAYPHAPWLTKKSKGVISFTGDNEHLADAVAAIQAGIKTDTYLQAKTFYRG